MDLSVRRDGQDESDVAGQRDGNPAYPVEVCTHQVIKPIQNHYQRKGHLLQQRIQQSVSLLVVLKQKRDGDNAADDLSSGNGSGWA